MFYSFINVLAFFLANLYLAYIFKKQIVQVLPITIASFIGILFVLAISRHLSYINYLSIIFIFTFLFVVLKNKSLDYCQIRKIITNISFILFVITCIFIYFLLRDKAAFEYDELGCWALEVKTLYFVDGFSLPGFHTIDIYSDYLPGQMLLLWWFVHLNNVFFNEGLMYVGFYLLYLSTIFYLISDVLKSLTLSYSSSLIYGICLIISFLILPSAISFRNYEMLCVELIQSSLVGSILYKFYSIYQNKKIESFDYLVLISLSFLLISIKASSLLLLLLILLWGYLIISPICKSYSNKIYIISGGIICLCFLIAWRVFVECCKRKVRRGGVITDNLRHFFFENDNLFFSDSIKYVKSFFSAIMNYPLHINDCWGLDLTVFNTLFIIIFLFVFFYVSRQHKISKKITIRSIYMVVITNSIYFIVILFMHVFFFRENQYFDPKIMIISHNRYCEPLLLGSLILVLTLFMKKKIINFIISICFIFFISDLSTVKKGLITYKNIEYSQEIKHELNVNNYHFFDEITKLDPQKAHRILFIHEYRDFNDRLIKWFSCPNAVYFIYTKNHSNLESLLKNYLNEKKYDLYYFNNNGINVNLVDSKRLYSHDELRNILFK